MTKQTPYVAVALLSVTSLTACGGPSVAPTSPSPTFVASPSPSPPPSQFGLLTGNYIGIAGRVLAIINGAPTSQLTLSLRQTGTTVSGFGNVDGWPFGPYPVVGTVEDGLVKLHLSATDFDYQIEATLDAADGSAFTGTLVDFDVPPTTVSFRRI